MLACAIHHEHANDAVVDDDISTHEIWPVDENLQVLYRIIGMAGSGLWNREPKKGMQPALTAAFEWCHSSWPLPLLYPSGMPLA